MKARKNKKHGELWIKIKELIRSIAENSDDCDYDEKNMKIKLNSDDELSLNKMVEIPTIAIVVGVFFLKLANIIHKFS